MRKKRNSEQKSKKIIIGNFATSTIPTCIAAHVVLFQCHHASNIAR